jgi:hypothetical protein
MDDNTLTPFEQQILDFLGTLDENQAARGKWLIEKFSEQGQIYSSAELTSRLKKLKRLGLVGFVRPPGDGYEIKPGRWYLIRPVI